MKKHHMMYISIKQNDPFMAVRKIRKSFVEPKDPNAKTPFR